MSKHTPKQTTRMRRFSTLAGTLASVKSTDNYKVRFVPILSYDNAFYRYWAKSVAYGALLFTIGLGAVLFHPSHWIIVQQPLSSTRIENLFMLVCLMLLQLFIIIGTYSATRSTLKSRNPVPVNAPKNLKVAFATTRAPGEPVSLVENTLRAMKKVHYKRGKVDVWLLDETNDPELKALCKKLGAKHFSRAGKAEWNTLKPATLGAVVNAYLMWALSLGKRPRPQRDSKPNQFFAVKSKHGNFNSWLAHLDKKKIKYDVLAGVDTDHVPQPNYLERLLGYFRDADVAFVVGPQVYGNYRPGLSGLVARWAESQASFFQSTIQRAGNASNSPMFVGTNYVVRMPVLEQIGGFQPCITEDMATGLAIHTKRNPQTGQRWKSVYTPDVLAVGEGPDYWAPYFTQQWRWAAGTFDTWRRVVWKVFFRLSPKAFLHYFLMLTYYPMTAITWLLGMGSSMVYLTTGATAILAPWSEFVSLYLMTVVLQMSLYFWNRRFNVSPHEPEGSYGLPGVFISILTAPIYLSALVGIALGKKPHFVVTTKGGASDNPDWIPAFRTHLQWAVLLSLGLVYGFAKGNNHPAMLIWVGTQLVICLTPFILGMIVVFPQRLKAFIRAVTKSLTKMEEPRNA